MCSNFYYETIKIKYGIDKDSDPETQPAGNYYYTAISIMMDYYSEKKKKKSKEDIVNKLKDGVER